MKWVYIFFFLYHIFFLLLLTILLMKCEWFYLIWRQIFYFISFNEWQIFFLNSKANTHWNLCNLSHFINLLVFFLSYMNPNQFPKHHRTQSKIIPFICQFKCYHEINHFICDFKSNIFDLFWGGNYFICWVWPRDKFFANGYELYELSMLTVNHHW